MTDQKPIDRVRKRIETYKEAGQWGKAAKEYENLLTFYPVDAELCRQTADAYLKAGQDMAAIKHYLSAAQYFESDAEIEKTIVILKKILKIKPSLHDIKVRIADLYAKQEKVPDALEHYEDTLTSFTELGSQHGMMYIYKKIVELKPDNVIIHRKLADLYTKHKLQSRAVTEYRRLLKKVEKLGLDNEKLNILKIIIDLDPASFDERLALVEIYYKTAQFEPAIEELNILLANDPRYTDAYRVLGEVYAEQGDNEKAITAYFKYLNDHPKDRTVLRKTMGLQLDTNQIKLALHSAKILIDHNLAHHETDEANKILMLFKDKTCPDLDYQELYVKLLASLEFKETFSSEVQTLIQMLQDKADHEKVDNIKLLLNEPDALNRMSQFLTSGPVKWEKIEDHDLIDELTHFYEKAASQDTDLAEFKRQQKLEAAKSRAKQEDREVIDELPPPSDPG